MDFKKLRKIAGISLLTSLMMVTAACGSAEPKKAAAPAPAQKTEQAAAPAAGKGDVLVVYYSASGSTKRVAGDIAKATGGTLFEIQPDPAYTDADLDYRDKGSRVSKEHDNPSLRDMKLKKAVPDNFKDYKTVFIGYPIWWGIAAWPTDVFVKANDFTGKTVIPFCTSVSSGLGDSGNLLKKEAKGGNWQEGGRFSSGASAKEVTDWVKTLKLN